MQEVKLCEGLWFAESKDGQRYTGENPIEIYNHPEKGLCVWWKDFSPTGGLDYPVSTNGDGHIPIKCSSLRFLRKI